MDAAAGAAGHGRQLEQQALQASAAQFARVASDGCWLQQRLGNLYCGSLYSGLAALLERQGAQLEGRRVLLFSYGSGAMAAMLCLVGRRPSGGGPGARPAADVSLAALQLRSDLAARLAQRKLVDVRRYNQLADRAARVMQGLAPAAVQGGAGAEAGAEERWPGAWRLQLVDEQHRRWYTPEGEV
jgi:hydroxymethylglutaryl-CoA synthase